MVNQVFSVREQRTLTCKHLKYNKINKAAAPATALIINYKFSILNYLNAFSLNPFPLKAKSFM